ncbi:hypothetical protein PVAP13_3KG273100, partial [Panicum virgatum]
MASTAAALNGTLLVIVVFLVLPHPSIGWQPGTAHHGPDNTGQQPAARARHCHDDAGQPPPPTPPPSPVVAPPPEPTPTPPAPTPAPAVDCLPYCNIQCNQKCQAISGAGVGKCEANYESNGNGCYDSCTTRQCPDKCVNSGCSFRCCTCDNTYARSCCQSCGQGIYATYSSCVNYYTRAIQYCMIDCLDGCNKNCTQ